ncbi:DUF7009 family protein [Muriicola marianensis]|uniref:Uncharacterized protein n=1 Tax=Muriicola marianensis TaxID=1324801 RepID=A0ABQ1QRT5_9FLAO|nr:hypothetical protein [Muriicola marianensis]GGD39251.1 hypothetical protein GCM10011361_02970 [Muriicola marianensis]
MKIRIKGNSIRFRLTKSEVETLCSKGKFLEETRFKTNVFCYAVAKTPEPGMNAAFSELGITLYVNETWLEGWEKNEKVGFEAIESTDKGSTLHLLLEKDFVCLDRREEDQSDNYPNPKLEKKDLV